MVRVFVLGAANLDLLFNALSQALRRCYNKAISLAVINEHDQDREDYPPARRQMMHTLFEILIENPDGIQARDAMTELEKRVPPTDYENGSFPSGGRRYEKIARFSTVDLVKAGWMQKNKGIWSSTDVGRDAYESITDPTDFHKRAVQLQRMKGRAAGRRTG